jgi:hypothetical protein
MIFANFINPDVTKILSKFELIKKMLTLEMRLVIL